MPWGAARLATEWFLAEGTTTGNRDTKILVSNPMDAATTLVVTYLLEGADNVVKNYVIDAQTSPDDQRSRRCAEYKLFDTHPDNEQFCSRGC